MTKTLSLNGMCHGLKKWTKPKCYNGYNVKFVLLIIHFVAILKHNLSPWWKPSCLCEDESSGPPSSALHFLFPLSIALCVRTVAETSPHFIFTAGGCSVFFGFGFFFFFCKYGTYGSAHSPKAGPLRYSSPWFMCACVSSCQSLRKDRYESVGGFLKLPFLCLCSQISECRWEAMLK